MSTEQAQAAVQSAIDGFRKIGELSLSSVREARDAFLGLAKTFGLYSIIVEIERATMHLPNAHPFHAELSSRASEGDVIGFAEAAGVLADYAEECGMDTAKLRALITPEDSE